MKLVLTTKNILFLGINVATFMFAISYQILYSIGMMALASSEIVTPANESGIYAFLTFAHVFFVFGLTIVIYLDVMYLFDAVKEYLEEKNKGWL